MLKGRILRAPLFFFVYYWEMWRWGGCGAESVGRCVCLRLSLASMRREAGRMFVL